MNIKELIAEFAVLHFFASLALAFLGYALGFYTLADLLANIILLAIPFPITVILALPNTLGVFLALIIMWATGGFKD